MSYSPPPRAAKAVELCRNPWMFTLGATNAQRDTVKAPAKSTAETRRFEARAMDSRSCGTARPCCGGDGAKNLTEKAEQTTKPTKNTQDHQKPKRCSYHLVTWLWFVNASFWYPCWNGPLKKHKHYVHCISLPKPKNFSSKHIVLSPLAVKT